MKVNTKTNILQRGAIFSPCGLYRFKLWRTWDAQKSKCCIIMLNPSSATELIDDKTINRCTEAIHKDFGSLTVVNLFPCITSKPNEIKVKMENADKLIKTINEVYILQSVFEADTVVCAWGNEGDKASKEILQNLRNLKIQLWAFGIDSNECPRHPSRLKNPMELKLLDYLININQNINTNN